MIEKSITRNTANERLIRVLKKMLPEAPDAFLYKMLRKKNITLNHRKATGNEITEEGDSVCFYVSEETFRKFSGGHPVSEEKTDFAFSKFRPPSDFPEIEVLYEDDDVLIFIKPAGVLSQKSFPQDYSVNEWVVYHAEENGLIGSSDYSVFRPSVVNRLDRNTGGIMAAGLSLHGLQVLSELFRSRSLSKKYYAIAVGKTKEKDRLISYARKNEKENTVSVFREPVPGSRKMVTDYETVFYEPRTDLSLVRLFLETGRSHQIRVHMASIGHPLLGDTKYGNREKNREMKRTRQCLFSYEMEFPECALQVSGKKFSVAVPEDWGQYL